MIDSALTLHPVIQAIAVVALVVLLPSLVGVVDRIKGQPRNDDGDYAPYRKTRVKRYYYAAGAGTIAALLVYLIV